MTSESRANLKVGRRGLLLSAGTLGGSAIVSGCASGRSLSPLAAMVPGAAGQCLVTPQQIDGPYYLNKEFVRSDITEGLSGIPFLVRVHVLDELCQPVAGARTDIWQADRVGIYSNAKGQGDDLNVDTLGRTFLRGTQFTDARGDVAFRSIYPGWYRGRTTHIHAKVYLDEATVCTAQMYFPDALSEFIYANAPGYVRPLQRDRLNRNDRRFAEATGHGYASVQESADGYICDFTLGIVRSARPPQGLEKYPPGAPPRGPILEPATRIKLLIPGS